MKTLLILGAGGHGQVVKETAMACGYYAIDFLDDKAANAIGKINEAPYLAQNYDGVFVAIGSNALRRDIAGKLEQVKGANIVTLIHPSAYVSSTAVIGKGTIVEPNAVINSNSTIGEGSIVSISAIVDHDCNIGDYCHINAGAICMAGSNVEPLFKVDAGELVKGF